MRQSVPSLVFALVAAAGLVSGFAASAGATPINYGNLGPVPPGVTFVDISESSGTDVGPLYGAPSAFATGLAFSPTAAFMAQGAAGASDVTDGQLNYTIVAPNGVTQVDFSEGGVYTLTGAGTSATQAFAAASLRAIVKEINGATVSPIQLVPSLSSAAYNLISDPGSAQGWQIALTVQVANQLAGLGYSPSQRATRVDIVIDNQLGAISEASSQASIAKTAFGVTGHGVPEPSAIAMAALALCGLAARGVGRRR